MNSRTIVFVIAATAAFSIVGYALYSVGMKRGMNMAAVTSETAAPDAKAKEGTSSDKRVLYWHDPMVPGQKFDKPGKSPFMDMPLVPVYAGEEGDEGKVAITPRMQQNLGVRTATVTSGTLETAVQAVGTVAYNERDVAVVQARGNGFLEKLYVRAPLDAVHKGQRLAELYVPDWVAAQEEYLSAKRISASGLQDVLTGLTEGARQRMRLAGMTEDQIRLVEQTGKVQARITIVAPITGVIAELGAREGMTVAAGATLFRINGLDTVWVNAEVPESQMTLVRPGSQVTAASASLSGIVFKGKVNALLPEVNAATRTVKARIELANRNNQLVPGMFVTVTLSSAARKETLLVPAEAVIRTGTRSVVIVAQDDGKFTATDVETGTEARGQTEIRRGLHKGDKVVVSGQFLIDSEASLKGATARMGEAQAAPAELSSGQTHRGQGKIEKIGEREITLSHGPIPSLQWGAMTMGFGIPAEGLPKNVSVGDTVAFEFHQIDGGAYELTSITPLSAAAGGKGAQTPAHPGTHGATEHANDPGSLETKK
jgi:Cu(I)/Ag(I) efflux system membrane fusion protein